LTISGDLNQLWPFNQLGFLKNYAPEPVLLAGINPKESKIILLFTIPGKTQENWVIAWPPIE